ncbi:MAG TPA: hypothetical protein VGJ44_12770, partial [Kribbellaceae bacterium]
ADAAEPDTAQSSPVAGDMAVKFAQCMREHSVQVADPQPGQPLRIRGRQQNEAQTNQAMQECQAEVGGATPQRVGG